MKNNYFMACVRLKLMLTLKYYNLTFQLADLLRFRTVTSLEKVLTLAFHKTKGLPDVLGIVMIYVRMLWLLNKSF